MERIQEVKESIEFIKSNITVMEHIRDDGFTGRYDECEYMLSVALFINQLIDNVIFNLMNLDHRSKHVQPLCMSLSDVTEDFIRISRSDDHNKILDLARDLEDAIYEGDSISELNYIECKMIALLRRHHDDNKIYMENNVPESVRRCSNNEIAIISNLQQRHNYLEYQQKIRDDMILQIMFTRHIVSEQYAILRGYQY